MNIHVHKQQLLEATLLAERLVGKKESLPVLSCVLIDVNTQCVVRSTNLEAGIEVTVPCEVKEPGVIAIPAGIFTQTLRSVHGDMVSLVSDEGSVLLESQGSKTKIKTIPPDEFPTIGFDKNNSKGITIHCEKFLRALQSVSYAASVSMIRPELGSVFLSFKSAALVCAATDSFRLAEKTVPGAVQGDMDDVLIPLKHVTELTHILEKIDTDSVQVSTDDSQLVVSTPSLRFVSRIIDGSFPNYRDIIPKDSKTEATILKSDLNDMLKKARIFSGADQQVGLHVYPKRKIMSATAQNQNVGEMADSLDASLSGDDLDINFNIGYLSDCLSSIESDSVTLLFAGIGRPLVLRGVGDGSFLYLVMPLNR